MSERLIRLIRILILIQNQPGIAAKELAETCEVTERTIYRDLQLLQVSNIPITNLGYGKGYEFIGDFSIYPLNWTEEEAMAFQLLPNVLTQVNHLIPPAFYEGYEKLMGAHLKEKKNTKQMLKQLTSIIQMGKPVYQQGNNDFLSDIIQATMEQYTIKMTYHTQSRNVVTERFVDPYYLIPRENRFYLLAYCHTKRKVITFRVSRIQSLEWTKKRFQRGDFDIKKYFAKTWSIMSGEDEIHFKVWFSSNIARYIKEEELFVQPKITEQKDGSIIFAVTLNDDREFLQWVRQYGPDAKIIEPVEYQQKMKDELAPWLQVYQS